MAWPAGADRASNLGERLREIGQIGEFKHKLQLLQVQKRWLIGGIRLLFIRVMRLQQEVTQLRGERTRAQAERDESLAGRAQLLRELEQYRANQEQLEMRLREAETLKDQALAAQNRQQADYERALAEVMVIRRERDDQVALLATLQRIEEAYNKRNLTQEQSVMTELELKQLIPVYESQAKDYQSMIEQGKNELPEDSTLRVPLDGVSRLCDDGLGHLKRISQTMHVYAELQDLVEKIMQVIRERRHAF